MTREEAIYTIERLAHTEAKWPGTEDTLEALGMALAALRPISREQVEKAWSGCPKCKYEDGREPMCIYYPDGWDNGIGFEYGNAIFCPECGRPLTDEAVEMVMRRLEALHETV